MIQTQTTEFAERCWPAADLTMELRITVSDLVSTVMTPPETLDAQSFMGLRGIVWVIGRFW